MLVSLWFLYLWLLLALQVKVGKVALFVGKILPHEYYPLYGICHSTTTIRNVMQIVRDSLSHDADILAHDAGILYHTNIVIQTQYLVFNLSMTTRHYNIILSFCS